MIFKAKKEKPIEIPPGQISIDEILNGGKGQK